MDNRIFEKPILNSPYEYPTRHWELDASGQPTQEIIERRATSSGGWLLRRGKRVRRLMRRMGLNGDHAMLPTISNVGASYVV